MRRLILFIAAWLILGSAGSLFAQGVQTGTIRGTVTDQQDLAVPGVSVTATSPALQGPRSTTTDAQGLYVIRALPPGEYEVRFELSGFGTVNRTSTVPLGLVVVQDVSMRPAGVAETVQVTGELPAPIATPVVGVNLTQRRDRGAGDAADDSGHRAALARRQREQSPNVGQVVINGAFAFDNVFMINGVDINDNLFATPQNLFIEDAIEETQVLTSGISAEYGRFTGGVINAITKSGGNSFSGSGRINFLNHAWTTETPFEECVDKDVVTCSAPSDASRRAVENVRRHVRRSDRARSALVLHLGPLPVHGAASRRWQQTGIVVPTTDTNKRGEIKITGTVVNNHTLQGGYLNDPRKRTNNSGLQSLHHRSAQRGRPGESELVLLRELPGRAGEQRARRSPVLGAAVSSSRATAARARTSSIRRSLADLRRARLQRAVLRRDRSRSSATTGSSPGTSRTSGAAAAGTRPRTATSSSAASGRAATRSRPPSLRVRRRTT